jgi:hypothetical protein
MSPTMTRPLACAVALLLPCSAAFAQSGSPLTSASAATASAMPHDNHAGLTISVDPYADVHRAKEKFGKSANPVPVGILPVDVFFKNDTAHPIKVDLETVQLEVHFGSGRHQDLDWVSVAQVANLIRHPGGGPSTPSARRFPVGIPLPGKDKKVDSIIAQLRPFTLDSDVIPPLGAVHGFLFFNMNHDLAAVATSSLYVPDVVFLPEKTPLMFFEVPLTRKTP